MKGEHEFRAGEEGESALAAFQREMAELAGKEASGEDKSAHFLVSGTTTRERAPGFNPSNLTEEDRAIWDAIEDGTITIDDFHRYAWGVSALDKNDPARPSRMIFSAFAGNAALRVISERELAAEEGEK